MRSRTLRAMAALGLATLAALVTPGASQQSIRPAQVAVNGVSWRTETLPLVIDGEPYGDASFLGTCVGATAAFDSINGRLDLSYFGRRLALASGMPIADGGAPLQFVQSGGRMYAPLRPVLGALGLTATVAPGPTVQVVSERPVLRGVTFREGPEEYTVALELSAPAPFAVRSVGTDVIVTLPTREPFIPAGTAPMRDSRGNLKPLEAPGLTTYDVGGALGRQVLVANVPGPVVRVAVKNSYWVPATQVYSAGPPSRVVMRFPKMYELIDSAMVAPGVEHRTIRLGRDFGPVVAHCVTADMRQGPYRLAAVPAGRLAPERKPVSAIARSVGAIAACNGGYFAPDNGHPLGLVISDGEWIRVPLMNRTALFVLDGGGIAIGNVSFAARARLPDGRALRVHGLNQWLPKDDSSCRLVHTPRWGGTYRAADSTHVVVRGSRVASVVDVTDVADVPIPADGYLLGATGDDMRAILRGLPPGQSMALELSLDPAMPDVRDALGGGPRLVHGGRQWVTHEVEKFRPDITDCRSPRTAVGATADGRLIMVVVDGRQPGYSMGLYLEELSQLMISLGAVEAMAFDSGGSAALAINGRAVNSPSDGRERPVPNAIAIIPAERA